MAQRFLKGTHKLAGKDFQTYLQKQN